MHYENLNFDGQKKTRLKPKLYEASSTNMEIFHFSKPNCCRAARVGSHVSDGWMPLFDTPQKFNRVCLCRFVIFEA